MKVMVVEAFRLGFEGGGVEADACTDPLIALSEFSPGRYGVVFLDLKMPDTDGLAVLRAMREKDPKVRVCFVAAYEGELGGSSGGRPRFWRNP